MYSSGAFSSVSGDRAFGVKTADDDNALLEIGSEPQEGVDGDTVTLFTVRNQFESKLSTVDAKIVDEDGNEVKDEDSPVDPDTLRTPDELPPEVDRPIEADLSCSGIIEQPVEVSISARGSEQSVNLTRSVQVRCTRPDPELEFVFTDSPEAGEDNGNIEFTVSNVGDPVTVGGFRIEISGAPGGNDPVSFDEFSIESMRGFNGGDIGKNVTHDPLEIGENIPYTIRIFRDEGGSEVNMNSVVNSGEITVILLDQNGRELDEVAE